MFSVHSVASFLDKEGLKFCSWQFWNVHKKDILKVKKNTFWSLIPNLVLVSIHHSKMFAPLSDSEVIRRFRIHKIAKSGDTKKIAVQRNNNTRFRISDLKLVDRSFFHFWELNSSTFQNCEFPKNWPHYSLWKHSEKMMAYRIRIQH